MMPMGGFICDRLMSRFGRTWTPYYGCYKPGACCRIAVRRRVNDAGRMRLGKCVGDLNAIPHRFIDSQSLLLNYLVQGFPRYVLHRDELEAVGFADVVDVNDVRMV